VGFGWVTPTLGLPESDFRPVVLYQQQHLLDKALRWFDSVWVCDHFYGYARRTDPFLESWTTLTWLAARYPDVQVGHQVLAVGYRNPALLAKMAATLQTLSGGRLILGLGAGYREEEYRAYGYEFPRTPARIEQLEEAVQICRLMWTETSPSFAGRHFTIGNANCQPAPSPAPPVLIGGSGERLLLPVVGRRADMWNTNTKYGLEAFRRRREIVRQSAASCGRDPSAVGLTVTHDLGWPESAAESAAKLRELRTWVDEGVSYFLCEVGHVRSIETVRRFVEEVITPLRAELSKVG
jgi:alkanesulfonate monooxygenase SsuD/methylene tetrahydromethanopterin reductase-like flavin-dependent oxidoreductase (luciferase family)